MMTENLLRECILPAYANRRPRLLDLGCGTGFFLQRRQANCEALGIDLSPEALSYCHRRQIRSVARADAARLPFGDESFDIVTAFDLIEHLPDDRALVGEIRRILKPGGYLMATVPAHPLLWTGHDVSLHHHRRYTGKTFETLFDPPLWETVRMTAIFSLVFPPAALIRFVRHVMSSQRQPHSDTHPTAEWLNRLMIRLHRIEADWLTHHDLPIGISLATIRRKR